MANLRFLVTRTKAQALVETTHDTPTNPGEADKNSLCLCIDDKCFVWRGQLISGIEPSDIINTVLSNITPIIDNNSNSLRLTSNPNLHSSLSGVYFKTINILNNYVTELRLGQGITTDSYGITLNLGSYLSISNNKLNVNIGTGLTDNINNEICVKYGQGLTEGNVIHELQAKIGSGLEFGTNGEIKLKLSSGLEFSDWCVKVKTSDIQGDGLKTDTNGKLTINTLSTSVLYVDNYDQTLAIRTGIGFSVDNYNRLRLTTEVKFDYNSTTGELNIITQEN